MNTPNKSYRRAGFCPNSDPLIKRMPSTLRVTSILIVLSSCLVMPGCLGTYLSRTGGNGCGKYPYLAIVYDVEVPLHVMDQPHESWGSKTAAVIFGILSVPFDLALDTVLLPLDLIAWPLGGEKGFMGGGRLQNDPLPNRPLTNQ